MWAKPWKVIWDQVLKVSSISLSRSSAYYFSISLRSFSKDRTEVGGRIKWDHMTPFLGASCGRRKSLEAVSSDPSS